MSSPVWKRLAAQFSRMSADINNTTWKRRTALGAGFVLYTATGWAGYRYLQDTRYRATGEASPYRPTKGPTHEEIVKAGVVPPHDTTDVYDGLAREYDSKINLEEITSYIWWMRRRLGKEIRGDALEVACGTGRNLRWLYPTQLRSLTLLDSSLPMLEVSKEKFDKAASKFDGKPVQFVKGHVEDLAKLTSKSQQKFDTIYETFGLCSHEDPDAALQQMAAVLKPGGRLVLLEHGRGTYESMNERMDKRAKQRAEEWGCRWNLDIRKIVTDSKLKIVEQDNYHFGTIYFYVLKKD